MLSAINGFFLPFQGLRLIFSPGLRRFVAIPLLLNILIFAALAYIAGTYFDTFMDRWLPSQSWLEFLRWFLWLLFAVAYALALFYGFTMIANLIAAPFNSYLSASVENKLTGSMPENMVNEPIWKTVVRTIGAEIRKMMYFALWLIPLLLLTFIPVINVASPFAWFLFAAWSFSLEYMDSPLGNRGMLFEEIREYNRDNRMRSLGLGTGVFIMTSIPVLNFLAMPVAVCAATRLTVRTSEKNGG